MARVDVDELRDKVKVMYRAVAEAPQGEFHFEMGRSWRSASATRPASSTPCRRRRSSRSPESATTSGWPRSQRVRRWSTSGAARAWTRSWRPVNAGLLARSLAST